MESKSSIEKMKQTWQEKQGSILTGNNLIGRHSFLYRDFQQADLPHYLLRTKTTRKIFKAWLEANRRCNEIVGCWFRPIFAGGLQESNELDTNAFNLQSPSFFIDMRFSHPRPEIYGKESLNDFSLDELFILSQQHCFSGYTLPELPRPKSNQSVVFTRHHMIDWNYHPAFPRNRPNRWFVQYFPDPSGRDMDSFKEYSSVRDNDQVPVYFERWQRLPPVVNQKVKYLVLRKSLPCPREMLRLNKSPRENEKRDGLLILIGCHFAFVLDREYSKLSHYSQSYLEHLQQNCKGAGGAFIRYLVDVVKESKSEKMREEARETIQEYLELEGNYGQITSKTGEDTFSDWIIQRSTFPWNENTELFQSSDSLSLHFREDQFTALDWKQNNQANLRTERAKGHWEVMECSFTVAELYCLFGKFCAPRKCLL